MAASKTKSRIDLNWADLLGFDQAERVGGGQGGASGRSLGGKMGPKIGVKPGPPPPPP